MATNHFHHVGMIECHSSNIIVNFINNSYNHHHHHQQLLIHFPAQQTMPAAAASTFMIRHAIFAFTIPTVMTLVQIRFPDQHLFHTHPLIMLLTLCSVIAYSLAFSLELLLLGVSGTRRHDDVCPRNWSIASGSLSLASLLGLLFSPPSSWSWLPVLLCFLLLTMMAFAQKLVAPVSELLSWFRRGWRTSSPLLPVSTMDFSSRY